jgi:hypothetical protein
VSVAGGSGSRHVHGAYWPIDCEARVAGDPLHPVRSLRQGCAQAGEARGRPQSHASTVRPRYRAFRRGTCIHRRLRGRGRCRGVGGLGRRTDRSRQRGETSVSRPRPDWEGARRQERAGPKPAPRTAATASSISLLVDRAPLARVVQLRVATQTASRRCASQDSPRSGATLGFRVGDRDARATGTSCWRIGWAFG